MAFLKIATNLVMYLYYQEEVWREQITKNLSFEDVSKSLFSSLLEDHEIMEGSVIVEMN